MYGNIVWYSKSRHQLVSIGINGGKVCYDLCEMGLKEVPEHLRQAVLAANNRFIIELETIFLGDDSVEGVR